MIDFDRGLRLNYEWSPDFIDSRTYTISSREYQEWSEDNKAELIGEDYIWDFVRRDKALVTDCWAGDKRKRGPIGGDDLALLPDRVFGFILRSHKWGKSHR
jgi:hypothetical protein